MPSTATITSTEFYTFVAGTTIRSAQVNSNFSVYRGHIFPIDPNTSASAHLTYDLGSEGKVWRGFYNQYNVMYQNTSGSIPSNPPSGYMSLYFKNDGGLYAKNPAGTETPLTPTTPEDPDWTVTTVKTSAYTATVGELVQVNASGGSFSIHFPTAVGNSGKRIGVLKVLADTSFNAVTMDGNGSETLDGATTRKCCTAGEFFVYVSDGSNWIGKVHRIPNHKLYSAAIAASITGSGSNPTPGTLSTDLLEIYRVGRFAHCRIAVVQTNNAGSANGTGCYLIPFGGLSADTSAVAVNTNTTVPTAAAPGNLDGFVQAHNGSSTAQWGPVLHSTTTVKFVGNSSVAGSNMWGAGGAATWAFNTGGSTLAISGWFIVPIADWEP